MWMARSRPARHPGAEPVGDVKVAWVALSQPLPAGHAVPAPAGPLPRDPTSPTRDSSVLAGVHDE